jgi:Uma2 family endonuclease
MTPSLTGADEFMSTLTTDYLDLVERLPAGASLHLQDVGWDEYEYFITQMGSHPGYRVSYNCGRLIVMSPSPEHEDYKESIYSLVRVMAVEWGIVLESRGAATFKSKRLAKGVEPDTCFYVQNARRIIGRRTITLGVDPPPDVAVEIDTTNESLSKFHIYAALGVPEIWRYDGEKAHFYQLSETSYQEIQSSIAFPLLTAEDLTRFLEQSKTEGQTAAVAAFLKSLRERK